MPPVSESLPKPVAAPERSLVQRMEALQRANDVRSRRAQLKRDLKSGRQPIHELLLEPPEYLGTAKVFDLLLAVPKYGRVKVNKILSQCRVSPSKTIGGLSQRQRTELVACRWCSRSRFRARVRSGGPCRKPRRCSSLRPPAKRSEHGSYSAELTPLSRSRPGFARPSGNSTPSGSSSTW